MVERQYPYLLQLEDSTGSNVRDADGNYQESQSVYVDIGQCRDETNDSGKVTASTDGEQVTFSWIVYTPLSVPDLDFGKNVQVVDKTGKIRAKGSVKNFRRGEFNCKIWL